jgi:hypothetical protein
MKKRNLIKLGTPTILGMVGVSVAISSCSSAKDNITSVNIKGPSHLTALIGQADNHAAEYLAIDNLGKIVTQEGAR